MEDDKKFFQRPPNPRDTASFLSKMTFFYTIPMYYKILKKDLDESDFTETLNSCKSSKLGTLCETYWLQEVAKTKKTGTKPYLGHVLWRLFKWTILLHAFLTFLIEISKLARPFFLCKLLLYFANSNKLESKAKIYAAGMVGCTLIEIFLTSPLRWALVALGIQMRSVCSYLIYQKVLGLRKTAFSETMSFGHIANLLGNDVTRFDRCLRFAHYIWVSPIEILICTFMMYKQVGYASFVGIVLIALVMPLQGLLGYFYTKKRSDYLIKSDERIRFMREILTGIHLIKMYAWENSFGYLIKSLRRQELRFISRLVFMKTIITTLVIYAARVPTTITILISIHFQYEITSENVFVVSLIFNILRLGISLCFGFALIQLGEVKLSIDRISNFLTIVQNQQTVPENNFNTPTIGENLKKSQEKGVLLKNVSVKCRDGVQGYILNNVSLSTKNGKLFAVVGSVGAGKTSLLEVILKELASDSGFVYVKGKISYSPQESWIFSKSLRQNILFGSPFIEQRYKEAVKVCALENDFLLLPNGDMTVVGIKGVNLSGGQKARINLCRAIYKEADIYLLDDPFSAVDDQVGQKMFDQCIKKFLKEKIVILVTHHLQYLKEVNRIFYLNERTVVKQGSFEDFQDVDFVRLSAGRRKRNTVEDKSNFSENFTTFTKLKEGKVGGKIKQIHFLDYLKACGNWFTILLMTLNYILIFFLCIANDYFLAYWVDLEESKLNRTHFRFDPESFWNFPRETSKYIYIAFILAIVAASVIFTALFPLFAYRASVKLHDQMLQSVIRTKIRFFTNRNLGQILNRFSKDLLTIDDYIPQMFLELLVSTMIILGIMWLVSATNPFLLLPTVVMFILFDLARRIYIKASTNIKRLEKISYSPLLNHISDSLEGLSVIRAIGTEKILSKEFEQHLDLHTSVRYCLNDITSAFRYFLDLILAVYITIVTFSFVIFNMDQTAANVGLGITQALGLIGYIQWEMAAFTELENMMTSVERIKEYSNLESEGQLEIENRKPPPSWPDQGHIEFRQVQVKYSKNDLVLKNINFAVEPQQKLGIIGRTGAGKSSLINALLQMVNVEGQIIIDGIDVSKIGLHDLRKKISVIPQDAVLFPGTLRYNLDPSNSYSDNELWQALEEVHLKEIVSKLKYGLDHKVLENGGGFSVGERQLFCLARIILRNNKILILDEATASLDLQTDKLLQETVRRRFGKCTILTIAHRINTILDSDSILVLDAGRIIEYGSPSELLKRKDSYLSKVVNTIE